jgi:hypothetical protein
MFHCFLSSEALRCAALCCAVLRRAVLCCGFSALVSLVHIFTGALVLCTFS